MENKETRKQYNENYYKETTLERIRIKTRNLSLTDSLQLFKTEIAWGPIYPCICCHRTRFRTGVKEAVIDELSKQSNFKNAVDQVRISSSELYVKSKFWICHTCLSYLKNNKIPRQSSMNSLTVYDRPDFLNLKEVENVLIAPRINFIKLIKLPVSRMLGIKDKIINVPISLETIKQTVKSLPRTFEEAAIHPILLKRKKSYLSNVYQQYVRPDYIRKAIMYLLDKYPFYEGLNIDEDKIEDLIKKIEDECEEHLDAAHFEEVNDVLDPSGNEFEKEEKEEADYLENDPVKKNQTDVGISSFLIPENVEAKVTTKEKDDPTFVFAPGEGQVPRDILREKHPFVLHFPCLFPDGRGGLHDTDRKFPLTPQQFIMQRLQNINPMFVENKPFLFTAVYYVEKYQLQSSMNISYMKGKIKSDTAGKRFLKTEDGFAVFDNIPGSPRYWQKMRYDLIAKLEQLGPFQFFYTLSCADKRWDENLATILTKKYKNIKVMHILEELSQSDSILDTENEETHRENYEYSDEDENEQIQEEVDLILNTETKKTSQQKSDYFIHKKIKKKPLKSAHQCPIHNYRDGFVCKRKNLNTIPKEKKNQLLSENVFDITQNFNNRVKSFRRNILMAPNSPLQIEYYQDRTEFQARGNGHYLKHFEERC